MKKIISLALVFLMSLSMLMFASCSKNDSSNDIDSSSDSSSPTFESAVALYNDIWAKFSDDDKFPCAGGDAEHSSEFPAQFSLNESNAESFKYLLHVTDELYAMLDDDAATLQHMMNTNTFSSAIAKLKDPAKASEFAEAYKTSVQSQQWMCGFPDKVVVISIGNYIIMAYGLEDNINNLISACSAIYEQAQVLVNTNAVVD